MVDREQYQYVMNRLKELCGAHVATFEINKHTVDRLLSIVSVSELRTQIAQQLIRDLRIRTDEYVEETRRIGDTLDYIGMGSEHLSEGGRSCLRLLASTAHALGCGPSQSSMYTAITAMQAERQQLEEQRVALDMECAEYERNVTHYKMQLSNLRNAVEIMRASDTAKDAESKRQMQQLPYFVNKRKEYEASIAQCHAHLGKVGFDETLRHSIVVAKFASMKNDTASLRINEGEVNNSSNSSSSNNNDASLARFLDLEPDVDLARKRVEAAKETLALLKQQYAKQLQAISVPE
jgi:hypothetical protein